MASPPSPAGGSLFSPSSKDLERSFDAYFEAHDILNLPSTLEFQPAQLSEPAEQPLSTAENLLSQDPDVFPLREHVDTTLEPPADNPFAEFPSLSAFESSDLHIMTEHWPFLPPIDNTPEAKTERYIMVTGVCPIEGHLSPMIVLAIPHLLASTSGMLANRTA